MVSLYEGDNTVAVIYDIKATRESLSLKAGGFTKAQDLFDKTLYEGIDGEITLPAKPRALQMYLLK